MKIRTEVLLNCILTIVICLTLQSLKAQVHIIKPVKIADVRIQDSFWSPRLKVWDTKTVYDVLDKLEGKYEPDRQISSMKNKNGGAPGMHC